MTNGTSQVSTKTSDSTNIDLCIVTFFPRLYSTFVSSTFDGLTSPPSAVISVYMQYKLIVLVLSAQLWLEWVEDIRVPVRHLKTGKFSLKGKGHACVKLSFATHNIQEIF